MKTLAFALTSLALIALGAFCLASSADRAAPVAATPKPPSPVVSITIQPTSGTYAWVLTTMRHDGHLWLLAHREGNAGGSPVHHPDCPCLKGGK